MRKAKDLSGRRFGRWTVLRLTDERNISGNCLWLCRCGCGNQKLVAGASLSNGSSQSCGCFNREITRVKNRIHGRWRTRTYNSWDNMVQRCTNPRRLEYKRYGGRGIQVCDRWRKFENFYADMGERPKGQTLDRYPDKNGNYEPGNCRWATPTEQNSNSRRNVWIEFQGKRKTVGQWEKEFGFKANVLRSRLFRGWPMEKASLNQWAD